MTEHDAIDGIENDIVYLQSIHGLIVTLIEGETEIGVKPLYVIQKGLASVLEGLERKHLILFRGAFGEPEAAS